MAVKIRLARHGKKNYAFYHIVAADSRAPRDGRFIELLGTYNPNTNPASIILDCEIDYLPADLMVLVAHPTLLFVTGPLDRLESFLFTQVFPAGAIMAAHLLVPATITEKFHFAGTGTTDSRT